MNRHAFILRGLLVLCLGLAVGSALADDDCEVPLQQWQSRDAVRQMAAAQGWQVQRIKIDDGCYEIRGIDAQGREFKARIDPQTLKVVKIKHRDGGRARERERERVHDPAAPSPQPTPDAAPRGRVE